MQHLGTKIAAELENPIDNLLLRVCEAVEPSLRAVGATPNMITGLSALAGAGSVWTLWHRRPADFAGLYSLAYFFDVLDGDMARRYGMVSRLGDVLDHANDALRCAGVLLVVVVRRRMAAWAWLVMAVTLVMQGSHLGCQQKAYALTRPAEHPAETLDALIPLCPARDGHVGMKLTRWFGVGTWQAVFMLLVLAT